MADREGGSKINTGVGFLITCRSDRHHGGFRMEINVAGDLYIDDHHTVEDTRPGAGRSVVIAPETKRGILPLWFCAADGRMPCSLRAGYLWSPAPEYKAEFTYQRGDPALK